jgi:hypothetical protein
MNALIVELGRFFIALHMYAKRSQGTNRFVAREEEFALFSMGKRGRTLYVWSEFSLRLGVGILTDLLPRSTRPGIP